MFDELSDDDCQTISIQNHDSYQQNNDNSDTETVLCHESDDRVDGDFVPFLKCFRLGRKRDRSKKLWLTTKYIQLGFLSRLLENEEPKGDIFREPIIKLFNEKFLTATALIEQRQKLWYLLRQTVFDLTCYENDKSLPKYIFGAPASTMYYFHIRQHSCYFLSYINAFLHSSQTVPVMFSDGNDPQLEPWYSFPATLRKDINDLWQFLGPVSALPNTCFMKITQAYASSCPPAQRLHLNLEMKWGLIENTWKLYCTQSKKCSDVLREVEEKISALIRDLLYTANHIDKGSSSETLLKSTPFLCVCIKELWAVLIRFVDSLSAKHGIKSFWSALTTILNEILQEDNDHMKNFSFNVSKISCKDPKLFCWWLLVHISPLYWYNDKGDYVVYEKATVPGNGIMVENLLRLSFLSTRDTPNVREDLSRCYLSCCIKILQHWHPNNNIVLPLWEYFHKKMNEMFYLPDQRIQVGVCLRDIPSCQWFAQVSNRCNNPVNLRNDGNSSDTSYELFLRIVALHLIKLKETKSWHAWKQLKGRFYSKFHKKKMEELSEQGILCFFNLFLTLAFVGELNDVSNKMLSFLDLLDFNLLNNGKKICIWKGYFVLFHLYKLKKINFHVMAQKFSNEFTKIGRVYKEQHSKSKIEKQNLWELISVYLESTQELLECSYDDSLGDCKLIGNGFTILFSMGGERELQKLLCFIEAVLDSNESNQSSSELAQSLWRYIFPHIHQLITKAKVTSVLLNQLTNLAVRFALLSINTPPESSSQPLETFHSLVRDFALNDSVTASVSCQFLESILNSSTVGVNEIIQRSEYQLEIIHTWFRCSLQISSNDQNLLKLTRLVLLKIPETSSIIKTRRTVVAGNVETALSAFIRSLGETFSSLELLEDTVAFREKALIIIGNFLKYIESFVKQGGPPDSLRLVYKVAASLVKNCAKIIYRKTQHDCLLPKIIDNIIIPLNTPSQAVNQCIQLNLAEFLEGLATLDYRRDEFIKRKIKSIFHRYFHSFNVVCYGNGSKTTTPIKHPFMEVLKGTFSSDPVEQQLSDFRQYVITVIYDNYLAFPGRLSVDRGSPLTMSFLVDLFERTLSPEETARNSPVIFKDMLNCLMVYEARGGHDTTDQLRTLRTRTTKILELTIRSCQKAKDITIRNVHLLSLLKQFIFSNINEFQGAVFDVLNIIMKFDFDLVLSAVPTCKEAILTSEKQRGCGSDTVLRAAFKTILDHLGHLGAKIDEYQF